MTTKTSTPVADLDILADATSEDMETTTGLTVVEEPQVAVTNPSQWLQPTEVDPSDVFLPRLKLGQAATAEVQAGAAKAGQWIVSGYEALDAPTIVPLTYKKIYRRIGAVDGKPVACWNHDGDKDTDCPNCRWQYEQRLQNGRFDAYLDPVYHYDVYVSELDGPATLEFSGTAGVAGKVINAELIRHGLGNFAIKLSSTMNKNNKGSWYTPVIQKFTEMPQAILDSARALVQGA